MSLTIEADERSGSESDTVASGSAAQSVPDWLEVGVLAVPATSESLEAWLFEAGALAVTLHDARDDDDIRHAVLEPAPGEVRLWEALTLVGLFPQGTATDELAAALGLAAAEHGLDLPDYRVSRLADTAWERVWMDDYRPMQFGPRFWLCPTHHAPVDPDATTLMLDPGLAFGSGTHATTAQCLEWLGRRSGDAPRPFEGQCVIDYGSGSGVLAIGAALLGASHVHAVDIDPQALLATEENARANGVAGCITVSLPGTLMSEAMAPVDLLLANILLGPLESLADTFAALVAPGGTLVLSGLLDSQIESLALRYTASFEFAPGRSRDGWALLEATRRSNV